MAAHAVRSVTGELDHLLAEQRRLADERRLDALLPRFAQEAGALLLVDVDEDRVGVRALDLHDVGGEIDLARLGRDVVKIASAFALLIFTTSAATLMLRAPISFMK